MFSDRPSYRRIVPIQEDGKPELWEDEIIDLELTGIELKFDESQGEGSLVITSKRVIWIAKSDNGANFDFDVRYIVLHAITRDVDSHPKPCIYCQLDTDGDEDECDELFIIPQKEEQLKVIFDGLSNAALKNPDPPEEGEMEGDDELIYNENEVQLGAEQARILQHLDDNLIVPDEHKDNDESDI